MVYRFVYTLTALIAIAGIARAQCANGSCSTQAPRKVARVASAACAAPATVSACAPAAAQQTRVRVRIFRR